MKTRYRIAIGALAATVGSLTLGGSLWWWLVGMLVGRFVIRLLLTVALTIVLYLLFYAVIIGGLLWILIS